MKKRDLWDGVIGQSTAVDLLHASVSSPVHAYMFVGPEGSGRLEAARAFAGEVFAREVVKEDEILRHHRLAIAGTHPDLIFVEPEGRTLLIADADRVILEASRSPVEATKKVIIVDRFDTAEPEVSASLLKTIEEPPVKVIFILLAEKVLEMHATIVSRCFRVDFPALSDETMFDFLSGLGIESEKSLLLVAAASGSLTRARLLAEDPMFTARYEVWRSIPKRLDGTGFTLASLVEELQTMIDDAQAPLITRHENELKVMDEYEKELGTRGSGRRQLVERQQREIRRLRDDELKFGLATLSYYYRDWAIDGGGLLALDAVARITRTAGELNRNPGERLLLQALLIDLPCSANRG